MNRIPAETTGGWRNLSDDEAKRSPDLARRRAIRVGLPGNAIQHIQDLMNKGGELGPAGHAVVIQTKDGHHHFTPDEALAVAVRNMARKNRRETEHNEENGYHHVFVPRKGVNEAKNRYSEGDPKVPYILTPTGWRVLEEALTDDRIKEMEELRDKVKLQASEKFKRLRRERFRNRRPTKEEPTKELKESQMELLEALCDAGYLSDEQLVEGVRSFLARSAEEHKSRARLADREAALIRNALKAGRGGALLGPKGTDAQARRKLRRKEQEGEGASKAAGRRTALVGLINRLKGNS